MKKKYFLTYAGSESEIASLSVGAIVEPVSEQPEANRSAYTVEKIDRVGIWENAKIDFYKLWAALKVPFGEAASSRAFMRTLIVYLALVPSGMSTFFMRGWRFRLVQLMLPSLKAPAIGPEINNLDQIGEMFFNGMKLILAKFYFDIPKIFILSIWGFDHIDLISKFLGFAFKFIFGLAIESPEAFWSEIFSEILVSSGLYVLFFIAASFVISPVFKIHEIRFAAGKIAFRDFFKLSIILESYQIYKRNHVKTLEKYSWGILISAISLIVGFLLVTLLPFLFVLAFPAYKLFFSHWPKAYNYGLLAEKLDKSGQI